jgi:hypothetical protein
MARFKEMGLEWKRLSKEVVVLKLYKKISLCPSTFQIINFQSFNIEKIQIWSNTLFPYFFSSWLERGERKCLNCGGNERKSRLILILNIKKKLILESTQFSLDVIFPIWYNRSKLEKFFFSSWFCVFEWIFRYFKAMNEFIKIYRVVCKYFRLKIG